MIIPSDVMIRMTACWVMLSQLFRVAVIALMHDVTRDPVAFVNLMLTLFSYQLCALSELQ